MFSNASLLLRGFVHLSSSSVELVTLVRFWTTGSCKDNFCLHQEGVWVIRDIFTTPWPGENNQKSSNISPILIFKSHLYVYNAIDETKFASTILPTNIDNFSFPESVAKGEWSEYLGSHYPESSRENKS